MLSLMFSVQDYSTLADSPTGLPLAEIFRQTTQSRGGAFGLTFILWIALGPCTIGSQLSKSPLARQLSVDFLTIFCRHWPNFLGLCSRRWSPAIKYVSYLHESLKSDAC